MAIQIEIQSATVQGTDILLDIKTTNTAAPNVTERMTFSVATSQTAAQIKTQIDNAAKLLWQALDTKTWTVP